jgi:ribA/ribD-fused uncharacterized protein
MQLIYKMKHCSYFIKDKALFGSFPTQNDVDELEKNGVKYFINLTRICEKKIKPYRTNYSYIHYPIVDHKVPYNWKDFAIFLIKISNIIESLNIHEKIYIHCKGGHGRSGLVVACLLCYLKKLTPCESIQYTTKCHNERIEMREKWRLLGSPQTNIQKKFVYNFFEPLYFNKAYKHGQTLGFSNYSLHPINIHDMGIFPTAEAAFNAYKDKNNKEYILKQQEAKTPSISKKIGQKCIATENWKLEKNNIMKNILLLKLDQHPIIKENLLNTGFRPIIDNNKFDEYWGIGQNGKGQNILGIIITDIRNNFYKQL